MAGGGPSRWEVVPPVTLPRHCVSSQCPGNYADPAAPHEAQPISHLHLHSTVIVLQSGSFPTASSSSSSFFSENLLLNTYQNTCWHFKTILYKTLGLALPTEARESIKTQIVSHHPGAL